MSGKYDVVIPGVAYFQTGSRALAMETGRGLSLREYGRLARVHDIDGVTVIAEFRNGTCIPFGRYPA